MLRSPLVAEAIALVVFFCEPVKATFRLERSNQQGVVSVYIIVSVSAPPE